MRPHVIDPVSLNTGGMYMDLIRFISVVSAEYNCLALLHQIGFLIELASACNFTWYQSYKVLGSNPSKHSI
jgi:hypothetical protein